MNPKKLLVYVSIVLASSFFFFIIPPSEESKPIPQSVTPPIVYSEYFTVPAMGKVSVSMRGYRCKADNIRKDQSITFKMFNDRIEYTSSEKQPIKRRAWLHNLGNSSSCLEQLRVLRSTGEINTTSL